MPTVPFEVLEHSLGNLCEALSNDHCPATEIAKSAKAAYWAGYLHDIGAKTIVVETDYTDGEYLEDYASYYVKCHRPYNRRCKRVHFFRDALTLEDIRAAILAGADAKEEQRLKTAYLGFIVARPLPEAVIGRSLIETYGDDKGRRHFTCKSAFEVSLFGINLSITSLPFQEQDTVLAACATVALWTCLHQASEKFGTVRLRPAGITQAANQVIHQSRPIPSHGLVVEQLCRAIRDTGLEPEVVKMRPQTPLVSLIYGHLKRGFPVLVGGYTLGANGGHAVAAVGYSERATRCLTAEVSSAQTVIPMKGLNIDEFYSHDDQRGPFARLKIVAGNSALEAPVQFEYEVVAGQSLVFVPTVVVIPIYNKVRVTFLEAQAWLTRLHFVFGVLLRQPGSLQWDLFLDESNQLKRDLKDSSLADAMRLDLLSLAHPRYVWRGALSADGTKVLEVLIDATDMARSLPVYRVVWQNEQLRDAFNRLLAMKQFEAGLIKTLGEPFYRWLTR